MRSKHSLKSSVSPFRDYELRGETLIRRPSTRRTTIAGDAGHGDPPFASRHAGPLEDRWDVAVPQMTIGWMSLGVVAGLVVGAGFGLLAAGPAGMVAGGIFGAVVGTAMAVLVLLQALFTYTIRSIAALSPRTAAQHVRAFVVLPALLLAVPIAFAPGLAFLVGPPLVVGLVFGPRIVRNGLRRRSRPNMTFPTPDPEPPMSIVDSPQEVT
jgi:hypothetical protein